MRKEYLMGRPVRVNRSRPHRMGSRSLSDYDMGFDLWYTQKPLPLGAPLAMQQGYVKAAKQADACMIVSMKLAIRQGRFELLPRFAHLHPFAGNLNTCGNESRLAVRTARAVVEQVKAALPQ